jgi:hypothetical protein
MTPTCHHCGSPWFEPKGGTLQCCDCGNGYNPQHTRAQKIATQLGAGPNPNPSLIKAIQALVEADEKYIKDAPPRWQPPPPPEPVAPRATPEEAVKPPAEEIENEWRLF